MHDVRLLLLPGLALLMISTPVDGLPIGPLLGDLLFGGNFKYFGVVSSIAVSANCGEYEGFKLLL